jgi:hypothetical protein
MILEPRHVWAIAREIESPSMDTTVKAMEILFKEHALNPASTITVPKYWALTVLSSMRAMVAEFPRLKFSAIYEYRCKLSISTIPDNQRLQVMKLELVNKIDDIILEAITALSKQTLVPFFLKDLK